MSDSAQIEAPDIKAQELQRAFDVFNQVSLELTQAYEGLQARVETLTAELAIANGEFAAAVPGEKKRFPSGSPCCSMPCRRAL